MSSSNTRARDGALLAGGFHDLIGNPGCVAGDRGALGVGRQHHASRSPRTSAASAARSPCNVSRIEAADE